MRATLFLVLAMGVALLSASPALAQATRSDAIWARTTDGSAITLDGKLTEPAWALAESVVIRYGIDTGQPGSGWKVEGGALPTDKTYATLKFLIKDNQLYMGAVVRDSSIGGGRDFNRFDGFLMGLKDHASLYRPAPISEYFYSWWYPDTITVPAITPGMKPSFRGRWAASDTGRTPDEINAWDAVTTVKGLTNSDTGVDTSWTTEMRFNLTPMGYDVTTPSGDVVEWNISVYDCDWFWPINIYRMSSNRVWWQNPWGNTGWFDEVHIFSRPDVTVHSGGLPVIPPELRVPNGASFADPVIDGRLTEPVWKVAPSFKIQYGNQDLRDGYPGVGPFRAGEFQPSVNGGQAAVSDTGANAVVKYFFKNDTLYLGFDVTDQVVQYVNILDRYDGFIVSINDRVARVTLDHSLQSKRLTFQVGPTGSYLAQDSLPGFISNGGAKVALALKGGTTVDTLGATPDSGYTAEMAIVLTKLNYPAGRGDGTVWLGVNWLNGESFGSDLTSSYATRTWWFRQYEYECCPVWGYLDPANVLVGVDDLAGGAAPRLALLGNAPNPFRGSTAIRYELSAPGDVTLDVFDVTGRRVATKALGQQPAGVRSVNFEHPASGAGVYMYRINVVDHATGAVKSTSSGKMMLLK
jgi:hypothetical protein